MHLAINKIWYIICQAVMSAVKESEAGEGVKRDGAWERRASGKSGLSRSLAEGSQEVTRGRGF